jgi:hypothetical protein
VILEERFDARAYPVEPEQLEIPVHPVEVHPETGPLTQALLRQRPGDLDFVDRDMRVSG